MAIDNQLLKMAMQALANTFADGGEVGEGGITGVQSVNAGPNALILDDNWWNDPANTATTTTPTQNTNSTSSNPSQTAGQIGQIASTVGKAAGIAGKVLGPGSTGTNPGDSIPNGLQDINGNEEGNPGLDAANGDQFDLSQFGESIPNGLQDINPDSQGNPGLATATDPNSPESQSIANASGTNSGLLGDVSQGAGDIAGAAGIAGSIASGNDPKAAAQIAAQINPLAKQLGLSTPATQQISALGQDGMAVMGLLQGIQQGGVSGDLQAAGSAAKLASVLAGAAGQQAFGQILQELPGPLAAAAALYTFGSNWQSGDTGGDALRGAEAGAAIGTMVVPVVGTIVGAVIGGAIGALSSVFGGGKEDPENVVLTKEVDTVAAQNVSGFAAGASLSPSQAYTLLAGAYDGGAKDMNNYLGKTGEINLVRAMGNTINQAIASGKITSQTDSANVFSQVVYPWLQSQGVMTNLNEVDVHGNNEGQLLLGALYNVTNGLMTGSFNSQTQDYYGHALTNIPTITGVNQPQATPTPIPRAVAGSTGTPNGLGRVQMAAHGGEITHNYNDEPEYQYEQMKEIQDPRLQQIIQHLADGGFVKKMSAKKQAPEEEHGGSAQSYADMFGNMKRKGEYDPNYGKGGGGSAAGAKPEATSNQAPMNNAVQAHGTSYDMSNAKHKAAHEKIESLRKNGKSNPLWEHDLQKMAGVQPGAEGLAIANALAQKKAQRIAPMQAQAPAAAPMAAPGPTAAAPQAQAPMAAQASAPQSKEDLLRSIAKTAGIGEGPNAMQKAHEHLTGGASNYHGKKGLKVGSNGVTEEDTKKGVAAQLAAYRPGSKKDFNAMTPEAQSALKALYAHAGKELHLADGGEVDDSDSSTPTGYNPQQGSTVQATSPDGSQSTPSDIPDNIYVYGIVKALQAAGQPIKNANQIAQKLLASGQSKKDILSSIQKNPSEVTSMITNQETSDVNPIQQDINTNFQSDYNTATNDPRFKQMQSPSGQAASQGMAHLQGITPMPGSNAPENNPLLAPVLNKYATQQQMLNNQLETTSKSIANQKAQQESLEAGQKTANGTQELQNQTAENDPNSAASDAARQSYAHILSQAGMPQQKIAIIMNLMKGMNANQSDALMKTVLANLTSTAGIGQTKATTGLTQQQAIGAGLTNQRTGFGNEQIGLPGAPSAAPQTAGAAVFGPSPSIGQAPNAAPPRAAPAAPVSSPPSAPQAPQGPVTKSPAQRAGIAYGSPKSQDVDLPTDMAGLDPNRASRSETNGTLLKAYSAAAEARRNATDNLTQLYDMAGTITKFGALAPDVVKQTYNRFTSFYDMANKLHNQVVSGQGGNGTNQARGELSGSIPPLDEWHNRPAMQDGVGNMIARQARADYIAHVLNDLSQHKSLNKAETTTLENSTGVYLIVDPKTNQLVGGAGKDHNGVVVLGQWEMQNGGISSLIKMSQSKGYSVIPADNLSRAYAARSVKKAQ